MKRATIHLTCDGQPVDFEIHDGGDVVVVGYDDHEADMAAVELGFEPSECLEQYLNLRDDPFRFLQQHQVFKEVLSGADVKVAVTIDHITEADHAMLIEKWDEGYSRDARNVSGIWVEDTEDAWVFNLPSTQHPRDVIASMKNKDHLSESLIAVLERAWENGVFEVDFSSDGIELSGIETHDW